MKVKNRKPPIPDRIDLVDALFRWYDQEHRSFVWRAEPGDKPDPYRVWLSEVMLQQTQAATVERYFNKFIAHWPTLKDLAAADLDALLQVWQGLGYYSRVRNLYRTARIVQHEHAGCFPEDEEGLMTLPGIGPYSAAAIAAIAFGKSATVVDGNVERVIARLFAVIDPLPKARSEIRKLAATLTPDRRPGDYAHAIMELGSVVCRPVNPICCQCPWAFGCAAKARKLVDELPRRSPRPRRPIRYGVAFWLQRADGAVLLRRRPEEGLLGGMMEIPSTDWRQGAWTLAEALKHSPLPQAKLFHKRLLPGTIRHEFSHFRLELKLVAAKTRGRTRKVKDVVWCLPEQFGNYALSSAMHKLARHALESESVAIERRP